MKLEILSSILLGATYCLAQVGQCTTGSLVCCEKLKDTGAMTKPLALLMKQTGIDIGGIDQSKKTGMKCKPDTTNCAVSKLACCSFTVNGDLAFNCGIPNYIDQSATSSSSQESTGDDEGFPTSGGSGGVQAISGLPAPAGLPNLPGAGGLPFGGLPLRPVSCYAGAITRDIGNQCNTGTVQCCNQLKQYNDLDLNVLNSITNWGGGSLGDILRGQFGIDCTSVGVAGASGQNCNTQPVCCSQVQQNNLVGINCTPINING
ncbi:unnamed protein product [Cunninghamella echinulata]